jgi:hypothetical protein
MRYIAVFLLAAMLIFGCAGGGQQSGNQPSGTGSGANAPAAPASGGEGCKPTYSFSDLQDGVLSDTSTLTATVTCGDGKTLSVKLDGADVADQTLDTNATTPVKLEFYPRYDGTQKLTVESDGEVVFSRDWNVAALGNSDTKGLDYDSISFKEWRAMAVDVGNPITLDKVRIFMKRIDYRTQPSTKIVVEIRDASGSGGMPGNLVDSVTVPINVTTLSDNWATFSFPDKPRLAAGKYWVVMKIDQSDSVNLVSDTVTVHYTSIDNTAPGNDYTAQMILNVDPKSGLASATQWTPLSFDKAYDVVVMGAK